MLPGYQGRYVPYVSPIWMRGVTPRKTGRGTLGIRFINAFYAEGVQDFSMDVRILNHQANYLVAVPSGLASDRTVIISHIEFDWIERFCPQLWASHPPASVSPAAVGSVSLYLDAVLGSH